jgi:hypothetical protein
MEKQVSMEKEFVPYELALKIKQLGFDEPCIKFYWEDGMFLRGYEEPFNHNKYDTISAPLFQQAFRWFRKEHNLKSFIQPIPDDVDTYIFAYGTKVIEHDDLDYLTHEEAEAACLEKLIKIVEKQSK